MADRRPCFLTNRRNESSFRRFCFGSRPAPRITAASSANCAAGTTNKTPTKANTAPISPRLAIFPEKKDAERARGHLVLPSGRTLLAGEPTLLQRGVPLLPSAHTLLPRGVPLLKSVTPLLRSGAPLCKSVTPLLRSETPLLESVTPLFKRGAPLFVRGGRLGAEKCPFCQKSDLTGGFRRLTGGNGAAYLQKRHGRQGGRLPAFGFMVAGAGKSGFPAGA